MGTTAETGTKGGRPGGDNGRGVKAVSGGGREGDGGDDVESVGEAQKAVGGGGRSAEGGGGSGVARAEVI